MLLDGTKKMIEALLFIKGEEGLSIEFVSNFMDLEPHEAENILNIMWKNPEIWTKDAISASIILEDYLKKEKIY